MPMLPHELCAGKIPARPLQCWMMVAVRCFFQMIGFRTKRFGISPQAASEQTAVTRAKLPACGQVSTGPLWTVLCLISLFAVDAGLFRTGWYYRYVDPASSTGAVEWSLTWLSQVDAEILTVGDSRLAEGFSASEASAQSHTRFYNLAIPGTPPRVWYYLVRAADPDHRRFRTIIFALDHYTEEDNYDKAADDVSDLRFIIGRVGVTDVYDLLPSFDSPSARWKALVQLTLKGTLLRRDVQSFLENVPDRLAAVRRTHKDGFAIASRYAGIDRNLTGMIVNSELKTVVLPPTVPESIRPSVSAMLFPDLPPHTGDTTRYRMRWLRRIVEVYRGSRTRLAFVEMPRAPMGRPDPPVPRTFIEWARRQPNVTVLAPETFRDLENPELFADGLHLNRRGRVLFTQRLARLIAD